MERSRRTVVSNTNIRFNQRYLITLSRLHRLCLVAPKAQLATSLGHKTVSGELHKQIRRLLDQGIVEMTLRGNVRGTDSYLSRSHPHDEENGAVHALQAPR